ncbi:Desosaminyl transferase EryCIII precursor [Labrenzia sp. THAF82]|uniref:glycosyltransferase n=1 Tax=Labrenzia sp. THAF82 TaxID=2587861 RepID=UPI001269688C|nr:glycosyltransferase [Labrenzia sp. THAF82]QFT33152.1 Desosaminyl transferase EryCIII precursor [Labrenzia sp. THAF82]
MSIPAKRILIASLGTRGDVQPYVALAKELVLQGAEVTLSTGEGFEDMIEQVGARARPLPINYQTLLQSEDIQEALFSLKGKIRAAKQNLALQKELTRCLWSITLDEQPDLILFNLKATVVTLAARRLGVPALPTALQPVTAPTAEFPLPLFAIPDLGSYFNRKSYLAGRFLMKVGLATLIKPIKPEAEAEFGMSGALMDGHWPGGGMAPALQAFSKALVPTPEDWSEENIACGYWLTETDAAYRPPADLQQFLQDDSSPVYLGFGSMPSKDPEKLTKTVLASLKNTGQRAVLATGWGGLVKENLPTEMADRLFLIDKAPHSWLFPRCSAVVHHGGAGTTHEALRWGKPSLICPVFGDQPFWGSRVHKIGAGPAPLPQKQLTTTQLTTALNALEDPKYRVGAEKAAETMSSEPGAAGTARYLLGVLKTGQKSH